MQLVVNAFVALLCCSNELLAELNKNKLVLEIQLEEALRYCL